MASLLAVSGKKGRHKARKATSRRPVTAQTVHFAGIFRFSPPIRRIRTPRVTASPPLRWITQDRMLLGRRYCRPARRAQGSTMILDLQDVPFDEFITHGDISLHNISSGPAASLIWAARVGKGQMIVNDKFCMPIVDGKCC